MYNPFRPFRVLSRWFSPSWFAASVFTSSTLVLNLYVGFAYVGKWPDPAQWGFGLCMAAHILATVGAFVMAADRSRDCWD